MSKASSTAVIPPDLTINPEADDLPTMDRAGVVAYCDALGMGVSITERFVRQSSQEGTLPHFLVRNRCMYSRADVREWLRERRRPRPDERA